MLSTEYAAGFFDGEGCVRAVRNVRVIISGCFLPGTLDKFVERWGGRIVLQRTSRPNQRQGVRWEITGQKAAACLRDLLPYLIEKREQAEMALEYHAKKQALGIRGGRGYSEAQRLEFGLYESLISQMKRVERHYS